MIRSRDNARVKHWAKLARDARYRRSQRRALIEGPHLLEAFAKSGGKPVAVIESGVDVAEAIFRSIVEVDSPQGVAAEIEIPEGREDPKRDCVFLEGIQDAGNVGAILRSAAAFGIGTVVLDRGCADPWSPKVLRAGMGGHFSLQLLSVPDLRTELSRFSGKVVCTLASGGADLAEADLSGRVGWVFGSEGRGLDADTVKEADFSVSIPLIGGTESLNVAAAAAICFYQRRADKMGDSHA
ncbi:MAG: RNA methyltransferase [Betaproteobacteria bacterium]|nr:RNA methyltransferase [Betaproteobacteria bacterium]